jgi:hypothetical protein
MPSLGWYHWYLCLGPHGLGQLAHHLPRPFHGRRWQHEPFFLARRVPTDARQMALSLARTKLPFRAFACVGFCAPTLLPPFLRQRVFPRHQRTIGVLRSSSPERASSPLMPFFVPNELVGYFAGLCKLLGNLAGHQQTCRPKSLLIYFCKCVGGIRSGCSRYQNSSLFHASVDQAQPAESVLSM